MALSQRSWRLLVSVGLLVVAVIIFPAVYVPLKKKNDQEASATSEHGLYQQQSLANTSPCIQSAPTMSSVRILEKLLVGRFDLDSVLLFLSWWSLSDVPLYFSPCSLFIHSCMVIFVFLIPLPQAFWQWKVPSKAPDDVPFH
jgi:hypothetical protein